MADRVIFKYEIPTWGGIEIPEGYELLSVGQQAGTPWLWALVDPSAARVELELEVVGTGHVMSEDHGRFLGTVHGVDGQFVFHVFAPPAVGDAP